MSPELELKPKSITPVKVTLQKKNRSINQYQEAELNFDSQTLVVGQSPPSYDINSLEFNIIDKLNPFYVGLVESECKDVLDISESSSFGDTTSGTENDLIVDVDEFQSRLCVDNTWVPDFDVYLDASRKRRKKVTSHWRKFIRPLMWRCKWIELLIRELQSQALKYDRKLAEYDERKQFAFERITSEGFDAKSLPFSSQFQSTKVMKRKKRHRVEHTIDIASYMSHHNLFSYYENKDSSADGSPLQDGFGNLGESARCNDELTTSDEFSHLEFQDGDNSLEEILQNIEMVQEQVLKLKNRINKVIVDNAGKFSLINNNLSFLVPLDGLARSVQNPASPPVNGSKLPVCNPSQDPCIHNLEGPVLPENGVSSNEDARLDILESMAQHQVGDLCDNIDDGILIDNEVAKEELHNLGNFRDQLKEKPQVSLDKYETKPSVVGLEAILPLATSLCKKPSNGKSVPSTNSNAPRSSRNRRKRKAGSRR